MMKNNWSDYANSAKKKKKSLYKISHSHKIQSVPSIIFHGDDEPHYQIQLCDSDTDGSWSWSFLYTWTHRCPQLTGVTVIDRWKRESTPSLPLGVHGQLCSLGSLGWLFNMWVNWTANDKQWQQETGKPPWAKQDGVVMGARTEKNEWKESRKAGAVR